MLDIQYRAWDYITEQYIDVGSGDYYLTPQGTLYKLIETDRETEQIMYIDMHSNIQLYTGLLDYQGNEIYEGDILDIGDTRGVVEFKDGCFIFVEKNENPKLLYEFPKNTIGYLTKIIDCKVIGNIFENKDLLEK